MALLNVKIEESWKEVLKEEFTKPYFKGIVEHIKIEKAQSKTIFPPGSLIFHAFEATPFNQVNRNKKYSHNNQCGCRHPLIA